MDIIIMPKDVGRELILKNVLYYFFDYETLHVFFSDKIIEFPARHIWYVESKKNLRN